MSKRIQFELDEHLYNADLIERDDGSYYIIVSRVSGLYMLPDEVQNAREEAGRLFAEQD